MATLHIDIKLNQIFHYFSFRLSVTVCNMWVTRLHKILKDAVKAMLKRLRMKSKASKFPNQPYC